MRSAFSARQASATTCYTHRYFKPCARRPCGRRHKSTVMSSIRGTLPKGVDVVIVGGGLAGLSCAYFLQKQGTKCMLVEASDGVGGRVRTDKVDGFLLDRGFQIFLTAYPEARELLDYDALKLKEFYAGALVWFNGGFHRVADPLRHFSDGINSLPNPVGSVLDKVLVGVFRFKSLLGSPDTILAKREVTIAEGLKAEGFSDVIIKRFFRPFLGGIFFDRSLQTSSRLFEFVMRMLALGSNCLPEEGIGAISQQLASRLKPGTIMLGMRVEKVVGSSGDASAYVELQDGSRITAEQGVVVAADGPEAQRLLGDVIQASPSKAAAGVGTACLYFRTSSPPSPENILYLNGEDGGIVNNLCFPSTVAPSYAPPGQTLVSVSTIGTQDGMSDQQLEAAVRTELSGWFGAATVAGWSHLRTYRIKFAQPSQAPPTDFSRPVQLSDNLFVCGDHRDSATFDGAIRSGRRAAEAILAAQ